MNTIHGFLSDEVVAAARELVNAKYDMHNESFEDAKRQLHIAVRNLESYEKAVNNKENLGLYMQMRMRNAWKHGRAGIKP